jgi:ribosomal protein S18 acetylase RimI-like enzyme
MARVLAEAFAVFEPVYTPGAFAATTPSAEAIGERFSEGPKWVAEQPGALVGTASAVAKDTGLYVRSVAVLPAARGQRVGQALTPHLIRK